MEQTTNKDQIPPESEQPREEAKHFNTHHNVVSIFKDNVVDAIETRYKGNRKAIKILLCSLINANPIYPTKLHIAFNGDSDSGKTTGMETTIHMVNDAHKYNSRSVSPKAIFYDSQTIYNKEGELIRQGTSFKHKVIFLDDVAFKDIEILKQLANSSYDAPTYTTIDKNGFIKTLKLDGKPTVWTTRVEMFDDHENQTDRRFFKVEIQKQDIKRDIFESDDIIDDDKNNIRSSLYGVMNWNVKVNIPRGVDISCCDSNTDVRILRCLILGITKINKAELIGTPEITADIQDINEAIELFKSQSIQKTNIRESALRLLKFIPESEPVMDEHGEIFSAGYTIEDIYAKQDVSPSMRVVRNNIAKLLKKGKLSEISGKFNRKYFFRVPEKKLDGFSLYSVCTSPGVQTSTDSEISFESILRGV